MNPRIYEKIADEIEKMIVRDRMETLPTIIELAEKWGVAYQTMWKAVSLLSEKGIICTRRGKRIAITLAGTDKKSSKDIAGWSSSTDRAYKVVKDRILNGIYQSRRQLPKTEFIAVSEGVSRVTVLRLFHRLEKDGLIHRQRRRWIVGPPYRAAAPRVVRLSSENSPVICMLGNDKFDWYEHFNAPFTQQFMSIFTSEIMNHGCQMRHLNRSQKDTPGAPSVLTPFSEIKSFIDNLGSRYAGSILLSAFPVEENLGSWISSLSHFRKPVVFFDHADKGASIDTISSRLSAPYYRLHLNEKDAINLVLDELAKLGHRTVGVQYSPRIDWAVRRVELIRQCAVSTQPSMTIVASESTPPEDAIFLQPISPDPHQFTTYIKKKLASDLKEPTNRLTDRQYHKLLIENTRSFWELVAEKKITALICLNDFLAFNHYAWCQEIGVKVPHDLSIISFDNIQASSIMPIATVDWGFANFGYLAAHIFIGDIPVGSGRTQAIGSKSILVDRGSLAKPKIR